MKNIREHWFPYLLTLVIIVIIVIKLVSRKSGPDDSSGPSAISIVPDINDLAGSPDEDLIRYGRDLVTSTSKYFGPKGSIAAITNGMDCGNCHMEAGTKLYTNNFLGVVSTYPKFRERSGRVESIEFRVNECMQRSLDGKAIDSNSREMNALVAYIKWTGKNVNEYPNTDVIKTNELKFLERAADPAIGKNIYDVKCSSCHGMNGEGVSGSGATAYKYPPLWGNNSYAVSAGLYRLTKLASFVKNNMPLGAAYANPQLKDEEAWDVAAYINSQPHPNKMFAYDWPVLKTKPVDYPFGPYADNFSEEMHKYGPYGDIASSAKIK